MIKNYVTFLMLLFGTSYFFAQDVSGTVTDDTAIPLPGVSVIIKGTTTGTVTDFDGKYTITATDGDVLVFSYVGFDTQEITVSGSTIDVQMASGVSLEQIVVVGSRNPNRTATESAVPVDIIDVKELTQSAPQVSVNQILNYAAPSFSSNSQTIADGTDHLDPAQLRGLGPDQVLVLINGKRRHTSSLVNVNGSVGRGSVGTDLNAIPAYAIKRIEVLRDGAAAQYGSDAIAGVINIVLKDQTDGLEMTITSGANFTDEANFQTGGTDGENVQVDANYGISLNDKGGFVNFTGSFFSRNYASRADAFTGTIYNLYNVGERLNGGFDGATNFIENNSLVALANNVIAEDSELANIYNGALSDGETSSRDALVTNFGISQAEAEAAIRLRRNASDYELAQRGTDRRDFSMRVGQSRLRTGKFFSNFSLPLNDEGTEIYSAIGLGFRSGESAGFYRRPAQERAFTGIYPDGFLPEIHTTIIDQSIIAGIKGKMGNWNVDFSNTWGRNSFDFEVQNSSNATLQEASDLTYEAGGFAFTQNTANLDFSRFYEDIASGLNVAFGAEYRAERYEIFAGSEGSYGLYDDEGDLIVNDSGPVSATDGRVYDNLYRRRPGGVQVFPGYRPENELDQTRNSIGFYGDAELDVTEKFLITSAVRYENYSDFGGTLNGKFSTLIKASDNVNIRGALSTGFRAPSLHQINFNSVSTLFVGGVGSEVLTASNNDKIARDLGIDQLDEETSLSASLGFTAKIPSANLTFTVDGYFTRVNDRITLTDQIRPSDYASAPNAQDINDAFIAAEAERVQLFGNFVDTETMGIDIVIDHKWNIGDNARLNTNFAATFADNEVVGTNIPSDLATPDLEARVVSQGTRSFIEDAFPRTKMNLTHNFTSGKWNIFLRNAFFGEVFDADVFTSTNSAFTTLPESPEREEEATYTSRVVTDLSIGFDLAEDLNITIGANNLFDVYPERQPLGTNGADQFIYSRRVSQFGINGRALFARLSFKLK